MKYLSKLLLLLLSTALLSSCKTLTYGYEPGSIGDMYGFEKILVKGGDFWITTYQKVSNKHKPYVFYIEGDGAAFSGRYKVSHNPTPRRQMFINLAAMDDRPNIVYIARPCQYTPMELNPKCKMQYWTDKRMSDDSVQAINDVINKINNQHKFSLIGFSGGGGIAVLVAARNYMVKDITTIAANLDHVAFTTLHNVTPMIGSLNPIEYTEQVKNIPQLHISGGKDTVIPPFIADKFVQKASSNCVKQKIYEDISHTHGWKRIWEYVYTRPVRCYD
jgi:dienelactone hydrolase